MTFEIDISCTSPDIDPAAIEHALVHGLTVEEVRSAVLSISIVDNATIHDLNRRHLQHDYPTDVISFQLQWTCDEVRQESRSQQPDGRAAGAAIEGEIVVSHEYARQTAPRCGWSAQDELTLYVIHGMLHICAYDDLTDTDKKYMRARERAILKGLGLEPEYPDDIAAAEDEPPEQRISVTSHTQSGSRS